MKNVTHERRRQAGLCVECGKPALPGHTRCPECAQAEREYAALRYRTYKNAHRCVSCHRKMRDEWQGALCRKCLTALRKHRKEQKNEQDVGADG